MHALCTLTHSIGFALQIRRLGWVDTKSGEGDTSCALVKENGTKQLYFGQQVLRGTPKGSNYY
jgi:hypothetical protein